MQKVPARRNVQVWFLPGTAVFSKHKQGEYIKLTTSKKNWTLSVWNSTENSALTNIKVFNQIIDPNIISLLLAHRRQKFWVFWMLEIAEEQSGNKVQFQI